MNVVKLCCCHIATKDATCSKNGVSKSSQNIMDEMPHSKCRNAVYAGGVARFSVPDDKVSWKIPFSDYKPVVFTDPIVLAGPVWADPELLRDGGNGVVKLERALQFNALDGNISRESFTGKYALSEDGLPLNPKGRTGIRGRALLGRWGPNHAADPIVTRWKRDSNGEVAHHAISKKPILQFVSIKRWDSDEWAIPGGMVDPGENISVTLKREFGEEAMSSLEGDEEHRQAVEQLINEQLRGCGQLVYRGYVDDPRNTDNAWMETQAFNFHDESGKGVGCVPLKSGDDAKAVTWMDISDELQLYASHKNFIEQVAQLHNAHWSVIN